jgi:transposase
MNIVGAKCEDKIVGRAEYDCSMDSRVFETWFAMFLTLIVAGSVIIMDNAPFHRKKVLKAMAEAAGCRVIFLPAYSPDFNPIEKVWANLKKFLKNNLRNFSTLSDAVYHYFEVA